MAGRKIDFTIPLQSNMSTDEPSSLPSSPTVADADITMELPYATPNYSLAIQSKRALTVRNALVASKLSSCTVETLLRTIEANASDGAAVEKDEFIEMVRILPELRSGEAFRPVEETLERIYRSFDAANRVDLYLLGIGCLPLIHGSAKEKLHGAIKLSLFGCGVPMDDPISLSVLKTALACVLLSITAVFDLDSATSEQLQSTSTIVTTSVSEAVARLFSFYSLGRDGAASFEAQIWPWIETNAAKACPWLKFVDQNKWPTTKRLTSPTKSDATGASSPRRWASQSSITSSQADGVDSVGESQATTAATSTSVDQTALSFRFSDVDGGVLTIGEEQATALFNLLTQSAFTKVHPKAMYDTFVQHTGDGLLEEETFLEAIEELLSMTNMPHLSKDSEFLDGMIDIFRCFLPEKVLRVDAFEIAAGFSLFAWGSKSDKLGSAFHYFDADSKGFLNQQQLWRFLRSVVTILLYLSPPNAMVLQRHGSLAALVDTGEDEIMDTIAEGLSDEYGEYDDDDDGGEGDGNDSDGGSRLADERELANSELRAGVFTFEDFGLWYNSGGFKGMSWLELLDLRKWMFVSPGFDVDLLDVQPVDPVYASSNYYTANNIQVDVDADNIDDLKDGANQFAFADKIVEEDDEDDDSIGGSTAAPPQSIHNAQLDPPGNSQSSFGSSASEPRSRSSSIPSSLPVFCLKNEVVLEFDLTLDADDDTLPELPLTTLSFNNGDLLMYAELQRVTKLQLVDLNRVYEVFAPLMERPGASSIEKSTFDRCVRQLLPREVAGDVVAAFGVHTNTRIPPPSVGRGNHAKMAADTLSRLFFAFNRGGTGKIDLVEFVSAFSMFSAGTKSQKLGYAYSLFDADHDGSLTRREMWKYLRSFLTMLLALGNGSELSAEAIASVADTTAIQIADTIFRDSGKTFSVRRTSPRRGNESHRRSLESADADLMTTNRSRHNARSRYEHRGSLPDNDSIRLTGAAQSAAGAGAGNAFIRGGVVSFQEFATWYSTRGHIIIAWIELLDTRKWPEVHPPVADAILRYISRQQRVILPAGRPDDDDRDSGSSNDTESSTESSHFLRSRNGSVDQSYPDTNMTIISAADMRTGVNGSTALERMDGIGGIADLITSPPTSSSGTIKDLSSVALQFKLMNFDNTTLRIRLKDVAIVYTISERMNMSSMTCRDLVNLLDKYAQGRTLSKQGYLRAMRELVPRDVLSNEDQEFLSFHLLRIYTLFETESAGESDEFGPSSPDHGGGGSFMGEQDAVGAATASSVDKLLVLSGLSIFCGTTKSAKLGTLFKVFDPQGRGSVSRRYLFELLKSILVVLFAFSSLNANRAHSNDTTTTNSWSTNSVAERAAGALISKIFCEASCRHHDVITLAEFAAWYAAGGYMDCPWLELLDLSKWPAKEAFEASKSEKHLICAFDLQDEGNILNFTETDMSTYLFVLRATNLLEMSVSKIYDSLLAYATPPPDEAKKKKTAGLGKGQGYSYAGVEEDEGAYLVISRSNFYECIRSLVSKEHMSEKAQQTSSKLLSRIFNVFDRKRCGRVNALELACGMSILGKGSKSQKLALAFDFIARMRQQRTRTLNVYASAQVAATGGGGGGGFGFGGINSISTGGPTFGLPSTRGLGNAAAMRRAAAAQQQQNEANALPHSVLFIYLRSFLLALMALSDGTYRLGIEKMFAEAEDVIEEAMGDLMTDVSATGSTATGAGGVGASTNGFAGYGSVRSRACVTFEQFGEWYNTGGYQIISWVELLDVSKWQQEQDYQEQTASLAGVGTARVMSRRIAMLGSQRHGGQYPATATRSTTPIMEHVQPIENYYSAKPFTQRKQVRQSEIVSTSYANGIQTVERRGGGAAGADSAAVDKTAAIGGGGSGKDQRESIGAMSLLSDGPIMVFSVARKAAEIHFFHEDITRLRQFLTQTQVHQLSAWDLASALQAALGIARGSTAALVTRSHFIQSVELVCSSRPAAMTAAGRRRADAPPPPVSLSDDSMELLDQVLSVFVREPDTIKSGSSAGHDNGDDDDDANEGSDLLEFGAAVCGLLVVCDGSLSDKLACAAHLFEDGLEHAQSQTLPPSVVMETLKSSLMCFLMAFYGMSSSLSAEVVRFSAELGAENVLRSFEASFTPSSESESESESDDDNGGGDSNVNAGASKQARALELGKSVSLLEFCDWFGDAGCHTHPWLELSELKSWPAAIHMGESDSG